MKHMIIQNALKIWRSDPQDLTDEDVAEVIEAVKHADVSYLSIRINGMDIVFKGEYAKNCVIWFEDCE